MYQEIFSDINGCDSTVVLNLTVNPELTSELNEVICQGATFNLGGMEYNESGSYFYTTQNSQGCDSTVSLDLIVLPELQSSIEVSICSGSSMNLEEFNTVRPEHMLTIQNDLGCDSTITLNLTVTLRGV